MCVVLLPNYGVDREQKDSNERFGERAPHDAVVSQLVGRGGVGL